MKQRPGSRGFLMCNLLYYGDMKMSPFSRNAIIFLVCILFAQIIVRGVFFQEHLFFHDEQARDSFVILRAWQQKEFITLGPIQAETGGVKLGPLYYYLLAPFLILFQFHPAAGTVLISLLWLLTLGLVFVYAYKRGSSLLSIQGFYSFLKQRS